MGSAGDEAEGVAGGVGEDSQAGVIGGLVEQGCAEREHLGLGVVEVGDEHVEVQLLSVGAAVWPGGSSVAG